jgi:hypothetical protein
MTFSKHENKREMRDVKGSIKIIKKTEIWILFMQIECINKSLVAFEFRIDDIFM